MDLYVLRHGLADSRNYNRFPDDAERPLSRRGIRRLMRQVKGMNSINVCPDLTITSPLVRAIQTAEIVRGGLHRTGELTISETLTPWADPVGVLEEISDSHSSLDSVMVVGHEPHLSSLVSIVVTGSPGPVLRLRKGALCRLGIPVIRPGRCGSIEWSLTPRQMIQLG